MYICAGVVLLYKLVKIRFTCEALSAVLGTERAIHKCYLLHQNSIFLYAFWF